jgi:predicted ATP-grasp superfamily ATP-dependent carboligase
VIVKPTVKPHDNPLTHDKAWRVDDRDALMTAWEKATELMGIESVMVQELIPGGGETQYSFAALCNDGEPVATLTARRARQYPRDFGRSSSFVETVFEPVVEEQGRAIVRELGWTGLIEVEFKRDSRNGAYKLLDVNGRVWTWHTLGRRAGIDFPLLAWRQARGERIRPVKARPGVRWVRLATDFPSALQAISNGELRLREWLLSLRPPIEVALWDWKDPYPALLDPALLGRRLVLSSRARAYSASVVANCNDERIPRRGARRAENDQYRRHSTSAYTRARSLRRRAEERAIRAGTGSTT